MGKHRDEPSDNFLCIPTHETSIQKHVHNYKCILMRLKLQADNHKRVQTTTITCIHKHTHVTHGNTFANTTFAKHPRYIVHMLKKKGNEFWWLRKLGVQGCSTKRLWQCNLRMVPLMGISGFSLQSLETQWALIFNHPQVIEEEEGISVTTSMGCLGA